MNLLILDDRERLRCLLNGSEHVQSKIQQEWTRDQIAALAEEQDEPFVLFWHIPAEEGIELVNELAPHWPANLCGCVLFSREPYANAGVDLEALLAHIPKQISKRIHLLGSGVTYALDPDGSQKDQALLSRLCSFRDHVLARSGSSPVNFALLEPEMKNPQESQKELVQRITFLAAKDKRAIRTGRLPVMIACPACPKRGGLHHALERLGNEPTPKKLNELLTGRKGRQLKEVLEKAMSLKHEVVEDLCRNIGIRLDSSPEWRKIKDHVDEAFIFCKILNPELMRQTGAALENCSDLLRTSGQWATAKTLALELRRSLDCGDCQNSHKVQL